MAGFSRFIVMRAIQGIITVLVVTTLVFILFEAMPGDPIARFRFDPTCARNPDCLPRLIEQFGLDAPVQVRYVNFMRNMFSMEFGRSYQYNRPVSDILADALPRTLGLFGMATIITYVLGVVIGSPPGWDH